MPSAGVRRDHHAAALRRHARQRVAAINNLRFSGGLHHTVACEEHVRHRCSCCSRRRECPAPTMSFDHRRLTLATARPLRWSGSIFVTAPRPCSRGVQITTRAQTAALAASCCPASVVLLRSGVHRAARHGGIIPALPCSVSRLFRARRITVRWSNDGLQTRDVVYAMTAASGTPIVRTPVDGGAP